MLAIYFRFAKPWQMLLLLQGTNHSVIFTVRLNQGTGSNFSAFTSLNDFASLSLTAGEQPTEAELISSQRPITMMLPPAFFPL